MGNYDRKPCVICDIDGTLADVEHRRHFVQGKKKDFTAFYDAMGDDTPMIPIIGLVNMYMLNSWPVLLCTGRPERYREITEKWLDTIGLLRYEALYMRREDEEYTPDYQVKLVMLKQIRDEGYHPEIAIDDRNQVVEMWRSEGLTCLQVAEGNF